jgi:hypothetical protein
MAALGRAGARLQTDHGQGLPQHDEVLDELEHRNLDRHGPGWEAERDGVAGDQGWPLYLDRFAERLAA